MSISEYFQMGGYAFYVWTSYVLTFIVVFITWLGPRQCERRLLERLKRRNRRRGA